MGTDAVDIVVVTLPGQPHGKGRPRFTRSGRVYTDEKTATYERALAWEAKAVMSGRKPFDGPVYVSVIARFGIPFSWPKKRQAQALAGDIRPTGTVDIDNILKSSLDGLNGIVFADDKQVIELAAIKAYASEPSLMITVRPA